VWLVELVASHAEDVALVVSRLLDVPGVSEGPREAVVRHVEDRDVASLSVPQRSTHDAVRCSGAGELFLA